jgi:dihydropteroate synthase
MLRKFRQATLRCGNQVLAIDQPIVMGIINATTDSFYTASRTGDAVYIAVEKATAMVEQGATIIDVGGMSSRPGAVEISASEEMDRILPVIQSIREKFPDVVISADTWRAEVAEEAIQAGATMINDISGAQFDPEMLDVVVRHPVAYVLMHMRGTPADMQQQTSYDDLMADLMKWFVGRIRMLHAKGIHDIVIDPGFGFAKTMSQNYHLISNLDVFRLWGYPVMIGVSRKSTLSATVGRPTEDTLHATTALHMAALMKGASVLRVHDVQPAMDAIRVYQKLMQETA